MSTNYVLLKNGSLRTQATTPRFKPYVAESVEYPDPQDHQTSVHVLTAYTANGEARGTAVLQARSGFDRGPRLNSKIREIISRYGVQRA